MEEPVHTSHEKLKAEFVYVSIKKSGDSEWDTKERRNSLL